MFKVTTTITCIKEARAIKPGIQIRHIKTNKLGCIRYKEGDIFFEPADRPDRWEKILRKDECEFLISNSEVFNDHDVRI